MAPAPIQIRREVEVAAPPPEVWALVSDPSAVAEWFSFADRFEVLEGEGLGRRQRLHGHWGKKQSEVDSVVTAFDPPNRLAWRHEAERLDGKPAPRFASATDFTIDLSAVGDGSTRVALTSAQVPAGWAKGLVMRLFGSREVGGHLDRSAAALRAHFAGADR